MLQGTCNVWELVKSNKTGDTLGSLELNHTEHTQNSPVGATFGSPHEKNANQSTVGFVHDNKDSFNNLKVNEPIEDLIEKSA